MDLGCWAFWGLEPQAAHRVTSMYPIAECAGFRYQRMGSIGLRHAYDVAHKDTVGAIVVLDSTM